jgi:hypothetical protein
MSRTASPPIIPLITGGTQPQMSKNLGALEVTLDADMMCARFTRI